MSMKKILIIPEMTSLLETGQLCDDIVRSLRNLSPELNHLNMFATYLYSGAKTVIDELDKAVDIITSVNAFERQDTIIGVVTKDEVPEVDLIVFTSKISKELLELRFTEGLSILPKTKGIHIAEDWEDAVHYAYTRAIINNKQYS